MKNKKSVTHQVDAVVSGPHHCFRFQTPFDNPDGYIPHQVGRMILASGAVVRIIFCKEGLKLILPKECKENGDLIMFESVPYSSR